ncbi:hypothetical protein MRB53_007464 [Persea americana]|uniref:Uncharacterized protein n=1 Tax=Persea americana TaxID=3435 RepID=A0ACC2MIX9_PERAE|nr:hypothetical protein MRB53_007464 [Persea americana]
MWPSATDRDGHQPRGWDVVQWGGPRDTYWMAGGPRVLPRNCQAGVGAASGFKVCGGGIYPLLLDLEPILIWVSFHSLCLSSCSLSYENFHHLHSN